MIMVAGTGNKKVLELAKYLRKELKETIYGLDDVHVDGVNILIKVFEEEQMKQMFKKHKPKIIIHAFDKKKKDFDQFKYQVVATRNLLEYMPKDCKFIYIRFKSNDKCFETCCQQAEMLIKEKTTNYSILNNIVDINFEKVKNECS